MDPAACSWQFSFLSPFDVKLIQEAEVGVSAGGLWTGLDQWPRMASVISGQMVLPGMEGSDARTAEQRGLPHAPTKRNISQGSSWDLSLLEHSPAAPLQRVSRH